MKSNIIRNVVNNDIGNHNICSDISYIIKGESFISTSIISILSSTSGSGFESETEKPVAHESRTLILSRLTSRIKRGTINNLGEFVANKINSKII